MTNSKSCAVYANVVPEYPFDASWYFFVLVKPVFTYPRKRRSVNISSFETRQVGARLVDAARKHEHGERRGKVGAACHKLDTRRPDGCSERDEVLDQPPRLGSERLLPFCFSLNIPKTRWKHAECVPCQNKLSRFVVFTAGGQRVGIRLTVFKVCICLSSSRANET